MGKKTALKREEKESEGLTRTAEDDQRVGYGGGKSETLKGPRAGTRAEQASTRRQPSLEEKLPLP